VDVVELETEDRSEAVTNGENGVVIIEIWGVFVDVTPVDVSGASAVEIGSRYATSNDTVEDKPSKRAR
jgi:hypothetical protein